MTAERIVIVGAGLAGAAAGAELRARGFAGEVTLVGAEPHAPYIRPPLSKGYLAGDDERGSFDVHPLGWYAERDIRFRAGETAAGIDRASRVVALAGGEALAYDQLLLATGSTPHPLPVSGGDLAGVHLLRTIDQADALRAAIADGGRRVVVVGAGWIGMEVAATARTLGNDVTVLLRGEVPLVSQLGAELGADFARLHEENGVVLRRGAEVRELVGGDAVTGVLLADGELVPADVVVAAVGAAPAIGLAASAGLETAGLPARIRSEHWANAEKTGPAAARSMLGNGTPYDAIPYFYTDQFDLGMEYTGFPQLAAEGEVVVRGARAGREFIAFWVRDDAVVAGMNVNVWDVADDIEQLVRAGLAGAAVDRARLADPAVPLGDL